MEFINDFSDGRQKAWCIHCGTVLSAEIATKDHIPSKTLLNKPYPDDLPTVLICKKCNNSFSANEQYFRVFLECVMKGSTNPVAHKNRKISRALERDRGLRTKIELARQPQSSNEASPRLYWLPDHIAIHDVAVKNARGHALFEISEPILGEPTSVLVAPLPNLNREQRDAFEVVSEFSCWPEVGSRMFTRLSTGLDIEAGWIQVQENVYRYAIDIEDGVRVRSVIHNYLATDVQWNISA